MLLSLALPPLDAGPLALVALIPALWAVRGARARTGAVVGLVLGLAYFGLVLRWLYPLSTLGWGVLVASQAAWLALALAYAAAVWERARPVRTALAVAAGWVAVEWARGAWPLGGFTWGGVGYTQHENPLLLPLASVAGVWGISFVVVAVNVLLLEGAYRLRVGERRGRPGAVGAWARPVAVAAALAILPGAIPLASPAGPAVDVAIVQGNVPKFEPIGSDEEIDRIVAENHARLHRRLTGDPPDLAIWPENALDQDPTRVPEFRTLVEEAITEVGAYTLVGAITAPDGVPSGRNETLLYAPDARVVGTYAKNHLVPFGEYVPWRRWVSWVPDIQQVPRDLTPGTEPSQFALPGARFTSVICFENAFPDQVRRYVDADTGFVVVSTNNASYLRGPASDQHLAMSELRAVENGRWVVHAAISGISAIVDPRGRTSMETGLFEAAIIRAPIPQGSGRTPFNVIGGWVPLLFLAAALAAFAAPSRRRARPTGPLLGEPRVAVVLPTYDERDTIEEVLGRTLTAVPGARVIVVDDSSPDGTGDLVAAVAERDPRVSLVTRPGKRGLASAYREGFQRALAGDADLVVEMDSDLSHRPEELPRLLEAARAHHVVIGSRYVAGGAVRNWGLVRRALSRGGNLYARALLGFPVADSTSGFRVYRRGALEELLRDPIRSDGYAFQVELAYRAWRRGLSVAEAPITFEDRRHGRSKLSRRIVAEALWQVLAWGVRDRLVHRGHRPAVGAPAPPPATPSDPP